MNDNVDQIKKRIDVVDLISNYITLKKAGVNYRAICPFHQEKTPSLMVSPEKQIWHCFGCSEGGDIFTFIMKMENVEFGEALKILADRAGVKLTRKSPLHFQSAVKAGEISKSRLFAINLLTARTFHKILTAHPSGKSALEYLKTRKLTDQTIKDFMIGYAPSSRAMHEYLNKKNITDQELQVAGNPDKFFKRIIFPIKDVMGNVLGFTGRVLDKNQEPKYLNTPETIIFHKSRILYNLNQARGEIKSQDATIVVEGQMDVIASYQAGVKNIVATSGTALTADHLQILYRYSPNIIFAFDFDGAGLRSAKKAYEMAIEEGFNVKMVNLNVDGVIYKDPGEMIAQDPKLWQEAVDKAKPVIDWYFDLAFRGKGVAYRDTELTSQEKKEIAKEILPIIKKIPDTIEQAHYVSLLAKKIGVSEQIIFDALEKISFTKQAVKENIKKSQKKLTTGELVLAIILTNPEKIELVQKEVEKVDFANQDLEAIYKLILKRYNLSKSGFKSEADKKNFVLDIKKDLPRNLQLKVDEIVFVYTQEGVMTEDFSAGMKILKANQREALKNYYALEIKKAESAQDLDRLKKLIKEFQDAIAK